LTPENETPEADTSGVASQSGPKSSYPNLIGDARIVNFGPRRWKAEMLLDSIRWQSTAALTQTGE